MMYKLYLFDFDGTLIDSDPMIEATIKDLYKKYKPEENISHDTCLTFSGPPIKESLVKYFPECNQEKLFQDFLNFSKYYYDTVVKAYPGVKELLTYLKNNNIKFALITSKGKIATKYALKVTGLEDIFDVIVTSDDVKEVKPNPEGVYFAMKKLNVLNKKNVIFVGDSNYDYQTSVNANISFAYVSFSPRKLPVNAKIDLTINSFNEFLTDIKNGK